MALLGTSASRQCNGYFQGYHPPRDPVFGAEGSSWTSSNGNSERKNDCYQIGSLPLSSSTCHLVGYKELLKQTILKHEAIFRDQVCYLHGFICDFFLTHFCKLFSCQEGFYFILFF